MDDIELAQEVSKSFTYSYILIFIVPGGLMEPILYEGMQVDTINICQGVRYKNLWALNEKESQTNNNIQFYL